MELITFFIRNCRDESTPPFLVGVFDSQRSRNIVASMRLVGPQGLRVQPVCAPGGLEHRHGDGGAGLGMAAVDPLRRLGPDDEAPYARDRDCGYHRGKTKQRTWRWRMS